jgi:hypothetical protein
MRCLPVVAQDKDIEVLPNHLTPVVEFQITINKPTVAIGETVELSFRSSQTGYVTLWDVGTSGRVARLYPNQYGGTMRVEAGQQYGAGGAGDRFKFQAGGPVGMEDVYAVWTRNADVQPTQERYNSATELKQALQAVERLPHGDWATAKVTFEIQGAQPGTPTQTSPPPAPEPVRTSVTQQSGTTYLLAMGANVGELTKPNDDAEQFAATMKSVMHIPSPNMRVVKNAYVQDFHQSMEWLRDQAKSEDTVVIYFSGHGTTVGDDNQDEADGLDEVFVMYDAAQVPMPSRKHVVVDDQFTTWVSALRTQKVVVFIDACFSGGLSKSISTTVTNARTKFFIGGDLGRVLPVAQPGAAGQKELPGGMDGQETGMLKTGKGVVYAAAQEGQNALEVSAGGLFTVQFLRELRRAKGGNFMTVFESTMQRVQQMSRQQQTPVAIGDTTLGSTFAIAF